MPGVSAQRFSFAPKHPFGSDRYWADLAHWYWFWSTAQLGPGDPHASHPDRDIVVFSRGKRPVDRFLGVPYTQFKLVADIDFPSVTGGTAWDAYRHYWRSAPGMEGGTVALLDGFTGVTKPSGGWDNATKVVPKPHDPGLLAKRVFGIETFNRASAALVSSFQARTVASATIESKFAWCVMTSYLVNMCWLSLNTYPEWIPDTMRLYLAGGPETLDAAELTKLLGTPWPKGTRGPFGGYKYAGIAGRYASTDSRRYLAEGRWPGIYTGWDKDPTLRWDNLDAALSRKFGIPDSKRIYGLEGGPVYVGRNGDFEIPHMLGRYAQRYQWMRKLSFFMPFSAWMGTVFTSGGVLASDVAKAKQLTPEYPALMQMWSLFGAPSRAGQAARSYFDTLAMYKNTAAKNLTYKDTNGNTNYGLEYYFSYALPLWADFFGNKADFGKLVQCNHAAWQYATTHAGPGGGAVGARNVISETSTTSYGLPCGGSGPTAPASDYASCAVSLTIPEFDDMTRDDLAAKKKRAAMVGVGWLVNILKAFYQAYTGNIVGLGFTIKDSAEMYKRLESDAATNKSFNAVVRSVPPPFLRNVSHYLNGIANDNGSTHRVHPALNKVNNPNIRFSTDPFHYWDWTTVKANGAAMSRELELVQRTVGNDISELNRMPQSVLYSTQVDTALRNFSAVLGVQLNYVTQGPASALAPAIAQLSQPVAPATFSVPRSRLPAFATGLVVASASIIIWRRRRR